MFNSYLLRKQKNMESKIKKRVSQAAKIMLVNIFLNEIKHNYCINYRIFPVSPSWWAGLKKGMGEKQGGEEQGRRTRYGRYGLHCTRFFSPNAYHGQSGEISFEFQKYI